MSRINSRNLMYWMSLIACIWIILLFIDPSTQLRIFFFRCEDFFADFYNTLIYIADKDPYFNELNGTLNKNYLPFSYMILYPFTRLTNYSGLTLSECWTNGIALISGFLFMLFSLFILLHSLYLLCRKYNCNIIILFVVFFSAANIYALERGNEIMISAACINYFILFKNNQQNQWTAILCLAIASVLKVFPAVFCLYYLRNKSYKYLSYYILITAVFAVLPFLFFERGFDNISQLYDNVIAQTAVYGQDSSVYRFGIIPLLLQINEKLELEHKILLYTIGKYVTYSLGIYTLVLFFIVKTSFLRVALLTIFCCLFPQQAFAYNVIYLFPLFVLLQFYYTEAKSSMRKLLLINFLFIIVFFPIQISNFTPIINNVGSIMLWLVLLFIATGQIIGGKRSCEIQIGITK